MPIISRVVLGGGVVVFVLAIVIIFLTFGSGEMTLPYLTAGSPKMASAQDIYYPLTRYGERITNRWYGKAIVKSDNQPLPCGSAFSGLHTGDDLEAFEDELAVEVPVYSIADGTVRQAGVVGGYGGLIVVQHVLQEQPVTAYYGHVDISQATVKAGEAVKAGQRLTMLGDHCSPETSDERKHLHFAIHRGRLIDVKGYIDTEAGLGSWINPKEILEQLKAQTPI